MKAFRSLLLVLAALMLFATVSGIQRVSVSTSDGLQVFHFGSVTARAITGIVGLVLFALAARGVSMRLWYAGAVLLLLTAVGLTAQGVVVSLSGADTFTRVWGAISQIAASLIVLTLFLRWWLPKRKEIHAA